MGDNDNIIETSVDGNEVIGGESSVREAFTAFQKEEAARTSNEGGTAPEVTEAAPAAAGSAEIKEGDAPIQQQAAATEEDEFGKSQLPKHARGDTAKQFEQVKTLGRQYRDEAKKYKEELETLRKQAAAPKTALDPELEAELADHRKFRRLNDYQSSPDFVKGFVKPIEAAQSKLEGLLSASAFTADEIAAAKKIGFHKLDWDSALNGLPAVAKARILATVGGISDLEDAKKEALAKAQEDSKAESEYTASLPNAREIEYKVSVDGATAMLNQAKLLQPVTDLNVLPEGLRSKEYADALNATVPEAAKWFETYSKDNSPKAVGELLAIGVAAHRYLAANNFLHKGYTAATAQIQELQGKLAALETKYGQVKSAGGQLRQSAPGGGTPGQSAIGNPDSTVAEAFREFVQSQGRQ